MRQALRPGCAMRRHYLTIGDRQVHYRRAGSGPALLALHASPLSSASLDGLLGTLADRFTVIAPDREGYGQSDPLPQAEPDVSDYARAAVEVAGALGLERFFLFGTHTGSKVALHAATLAPARVAHVVLDGLGAYSPQERADQLAHYTPAVEPVWHGGHLLAAWHQVRNMSLFWPWFRQERGRRLDDDVPDPEVLQAWVLDLLRASPDYGLAYRAAFRYDPLPALQRLAVPATLATRAGDPLHGHRDRLPAEALRLVTIGAGGDHPALSDLLREALTDALPDAPPVPGTTPRRPTTRQYVDTAHGQVHVRSTGAPGARTLLALHASPGSAEDLDARIALLARDRTVIAPDTLGNGYSDRPRAGAQPDITFYAGVVREVLDGLGLDRVDVYGTHTGACIAAELARCWPQRVRAVVLEGLPDLGRAEREELLAAYTPSLAPDRHGTHLVRAWHLIRDMTLFWPWFNDRRAGIRDGAPPPPEQLHARVLELLKSADTYHLAYHAAYRYAARERIGELGVPALLAASRLDPLRADTERVAGLAGPLARFAELPAAHEAGAPERTVRTVLAFLDSAER